MEVNENDLNKDTWSDVTIFGCYVAITQHIKREFGEQLSGELKRSLTDICEEYQLFENISNEYLASIGIKAKEWHEPDVNDLINKNAPEGYFAYCGRVYNFNKMQVIKTSHPKYFLLLTISLNHFSDANTDKFLNYQFSIYPEKEEFLKKLKRSVREYSEKYIPETKALSVFDWIDEVKENTLGKVKSLQKKKPGRKKSVPEIRNLIDIFEEDHLGTKSELDNIIVRLKTPYVFSIDKKMSFIDETKDGLQWNKVPYTVQYITGFIQTLIQKRWIRDIYTPSQLEQIFNNTFNYNFNCKPLQNISSKHINEKYLKPFKGIPSNI